MAGEWQAGYAPWEADPQRPTWEGMQSGIALGKSYLDTKERLLRFPVEMEMLKTRERAQEAQTQSLLMRNQEAQQELEDWQKDMPELSRLRQLSPEERWKTPGFQPRSFQGQKAYEEMQRFDANWMHYKNMSATARADAAATTDYLQARSALARSSLPPVRMLISEVPVPPPGTLPTQEMVDKLNQAQVKAAQIQESYNENLIKQGWLPTVKVDPRTGQQFTELRPPPAQKTESVPKMPQWAAMQYRGLISRRNAIEAAIRNTTDEDKLATLNDELEKNKRDESVLLANAGVGEMPPGEEAESDMAQTIRRTAAQTQAVIANPASTPAQRKEAQKKLEDAVKAAAFTDALQKGQTFNSSNVSWDKVNEWKSRPEFADYYVKRDALAQAKKMGDATAIAKAQSDLAKARATMRPAFYFDESSKTWREITPDNIDLVERKLRESEAKPVGKTRPLEGIYESPTFPML